MQIELTIPPWCKMKKFWACCDVTIWSCCGCGCWLRCCICCSVSGLLIVDFEIVCGCCNCCWCIRFRVGFMTFCVWIFWTNCGDCWVLGASSITFETMNLDGLLASIDAFGGLDTVTCCCWAFCCGTVVGVDTAAGVGWTVVGDWRTASENVCACWVTGCCGNTVLWLCNFANCSSNCESWLIFGAALACSCWGWIVGWGWMGGRDGKMSSFLISQDGLEIATGELTPEIICFWISSVWIPSDVCEWEKNASVKFSLNQFAQNIHVARKLVIV